MLHVFFGKACVQTSKLKPAGFDPVGLEEWSGAKIRAKHFLKLFLHVYSTIPGLDAGLFLGIQSVSG